LDHIYSKNRYYIIILIVPGRPDPGFSKKYFAMFPAILYPELLAKQCKCTKHCSGFVAHCIRSYSESLDSGGTFTITLELALFMIGQIVLSMAVWHCSVLLVRRRISTCPLRPSGSLMIGM